PASSPQSGMMRQNLPISMTALLAWSKHSQPETAGSAGKSPALSASSSRLLTLSAAPSPSRRNAPNVAYADNPQIPIGAGDNRPCIGNLERKLPYLTIWSNVPNRTKPPRKPHRLIRPGGDCFNPAHLHRKRKQRHLSRRGNAPNLVAFIVGKPQIAIWPGGN